MTAARVLDIVVRVTALDGDLSYTRGLVVGLLRGAGITVHGIVLDDPPAGLIIEPEPEPEPAPVVETLLDRLEAEQATGSPPPWVKPGTMDRRPFDHEEVRARAAQGF